MSDKLRMNVRIDFGKTRIDGAVVLAEFQDKASLTLVDYH
jgi:hypothetical protein